MNKVTMLYALVALGVAAGCSEAPTEPVQSRTPHPQQHLSTRTCSLATLPASANVVLCFTTTLQPGVWHGWGLELSAAQPLPATNGEHTRTRLNHPYILAAPAGYRKLDDSELGQPLESIHAFQTEFNGVLWFDVLRLQTSVSGPAQTVPVVVFWAQSTAIGGDITAAVAALLNADVVNGGQANALTKKINHAGDLIAKGKTAEAIEVLQGFIQQVNDLTYIDLVLSPAQGQQLIAWAEYMIAFI
ncbi:MAG TPA: hypothetical protein VGD27_09695 [Longimicrobiales bacterium]